jgi:hypothetical protein
MKKLLNFQLEYLLLIHLNINLIKIKFTISIYIFHFEISNYFIHYSIRIATKKEIRKKKNKYKKIIRITI